MNTERRLQMLLAADAATLKRVDDVLTGRDRPAPADASRRTARVVHQSEIAARLGITDRAVRGMIKAGTIAGLRRVYGTSARRHAFGYTSDSVDSAMAARGVGDVR